MIIVRYELNTERGNIVDSDELYVRNITHAKRILTQRIPEIWGLIPISAWKTSGHLSTRLFSYENGNTRTVQLQSDGAPHSDCVERPPNEVK